MVILHFVRSIFIPFAPHAVGEQIVACSANGHQIMQYVFIAKIAICDVMDLQSICATIVFAHDTAIAIQQ